MAFADPPYLSEPGLALVVGTVARRESIVAAMGSMGVPSAEVDDPYAAMAELCRRRHQYQAIVLSLQGLYREELQLISAVGRLAGWTGGGRPEVWLADIDGRPAALAEAMRLGVDALLVEDRLHRLGPAGGEPVSPDAAVPPTAARTGPPAGSPESPAPAVAGDGFGRQTDVGDYLDRRTADDHRSAWHEIAAGPPSSVVPPPVAVPAGRYAAAPAPVPAADGDDFDPSPNEPVLTAEELRALLQDQPDL
jgi:hypothetical protein